MPTSTMTTRQLSDLEYERKGCLAHEQRLIQEHEESLVSLRDHLENLDSEIVRLGGTARCNSDGAILDSTTASEADATASLLSLASGGGGYVPSIAPFPNLESSVSRGERKRRSSISPRKSEASSGSIGNKGKSKNEKDESKAAAASEKENSPSNSSSSNDDLASSSDGKKKRKKGRSSTSWPSSQNNDATDLANDGNAKQQPRKRQKSNRDDLGEPWTCECGEELPAGRARCGVCKKWKGGKRKTTWKRKDSIPGAEAIFAEAKKTATSALGKPRAKKKSTAAVPPPPKALDVYREVYRKVAEAEPKCVKDAAADTLADSMAAENTPRVEGEVVEVMDNMVSAVTSIVDLETKPKAKRTRKKKAKNDGMKGEEKSGDASKANGSGGDGAPKKRGRPRKNSEDGTTKKKSIGAQEADPSKKRKRGRPKKKSSDSSEASDQQLVGGIQRVVSTSDDEAAPKKRGRPRKNSGAGEGVGIAAEKKIESEIAVESSDKPTQQLVASDESTAKAEKQTEECF